MLYDAVEYKKANLNKEKKHKSTNDILDKIIN